MSTLHREDEPGGAPSLRPQVQTRGILIFYTGSFLPVYHLTIKGADSATSLTLYRVWGRECQTEA